MQKKLIALAIAGLSSAAFAQSNVTIYGVMDADFETATANGATQNVGSTLSGVNQPGRNRVSFNSSHIGFKGSESLGNGMTAVFQIESTISSDTATGVWSNRDSFVGLAGGFGTVAAGNLTGPYRAAVASMEVVPGATGTRANVMNLAGKALTNAGTISNVANAAGNLATTTTTATRVQNTLAYISPSFSGAQVTIAHSTGPLGAEAKTATPIAANATGTSSVNANAWTAGLTYNNGPLKVVGAWQSIKDAAGIFANDYTADANGETGAAAANNRSNNSKITSWILGAGYTFGGATTVNLAYDKNKAEASGSQAAGAAIPVLAANQYRFDNTTQKAWILSAKHVMGMHEFAGSYVRVRSTVGVTSGANTTTSVKGLNDGGASGYSLNYGYNLSKRSQLYAFYTQISNQNNGGYDFTTNAVGVTGNGSDPRAIGAGLRHSF